MLSRVIHVQKYNRISGSPFSPSRNNEKIPSVGFRGPVPSLKKRISIIPLAQVFGIAMVWVALTGTSIAFGAENFSFYFPSRHETLPLREINQGIYLPLKETLRLFGKLDNEHDRKQWASWQLNKQKLEVQADEPLVKVGQKRIELAFPVRYLDGKWWVPTSFLTEILTEIIPDSLEYHDGTRRVFIGDIEPNSFEVQFESFPGHARLILQFLQQTSVSTAEEKEGWTLYLGTRPLQPPKQQFKFSSN